MGKRVGYKTADANGERQQDRGTKNKELEQDSLQLARDVPAETLPVAVGDRRQRTPRSEREKSTTTGLGRKREREERAYYASIEKGSDCGSIDQQSIHC